MIPLDINSKHAEAMFEKPHRRRHRGRNESVNPVQQEQNKKINELIEKQLEFRLKVRAEVNALQNLISKNLHPEIAESVTRLGDLTLNPLKKPESAEPRSPLENDVSSLKDNFTVLNAKIRVDHTDAPNDALIDSSCETMRKKIETHISLHNCYTKKMQNMNASVLEMMKTLEEPIHDQRNQLPLKEAEIQRMAFATGMSVSKIKEKEEKNQALFKQRLERLNAFIGQWNSLKSSYAISLNMLERYINTYKHGGVASYEFTRSWGIDSPFNKQFADTKFTEIAKATF